MENELKRREVEVKILGKDDKNKIDEEYYGMIKAKLDLLQSE